MEGGFRSYKIINYPTCIIIYSYNSEGRGAIQFQSSDWIFFLIQRGTNSFFLNLRMGLRLLSLLKFIPRPLFCMYEIAALSKQKPLL